MIFLPVFMSKKEYLFKVLDQRYCKSKNFHTSSSFPLQGKKLCSDGSDPYLTLQCVQHAKLPFYPAENPVTLLILIDF